MRKVNVPPNQSAAANGGGPSRLQSARPVAAVAELGSLGGLARMSLFIRYALAMAASAMLLITTGCVIPTVSLHTTKNVAISFTEVDSGKPAGRVPVHVVYCNDVITPLFLHI